MRGPIRMILLAAAAACGMLMATVAQAAAATLEDTTAKSALLAVYGNPAANDEAVPVGGGLGRNFGFGANLLFQANTSAKVGENLSFTVGGFVLESKDTFLGATVLSNKTGETEIEKSKHENPIGLAIQFVDFQNSTAEKTAAPDYADTQTRPWLAAICGSAATCRVDARKGGEGAHLVEVQDVSFDIGPGAVVQGTVWGTWENGTSLTPPCIKLKTPPTELKADTLIETQGSSVGSEATAVSGKACLLSANNNYDETTKNAITIE
jgi:hypothetical protein